MAPPMCEGNEMELSKDRFVDRAFLPCLFLLAVLIGLMIGVKTGEAQSPAAEGIRIYRTNGACIYLFGSVHTNFSITAVPRLGEDCLIKDRVN